MIKSNRKEFNCICETCKKSFYKSPSTVRKRNFCKKECYTIWQTGREARKKDFNCKCEICKKELYIKPSRLKMQKSITCSHGCSAVVKSLRRIREIEEQAEINSLYDVIKNEYEVNFKSIREISTIVFGKNTYATTINGYMDLFGIKKRHGSEAIKTQWINNPKRKKEQGEYIKKHWGAGTPSRMKLIKKMNTIEYKEKSRVAKLGKNNPMYGVTGENHPHWNPSLTDEERLIKRKVPQNYKWIRDVYERDNYTCQCCGYDNGGTLIAHHLNSWHWDKDNRFNIENGVTLCDSCHHRFHKEYGYKDNTKEQFLEYLNKALVK